MKGEINTPLSWLPLPTTLTLSSNTVHVWLARLNPAATCIKQMAQYLSEDERIRARRFKFKRDKRRFTVSRGVLRMILGRYLQTEPNRILLFYGPYGKPYLEQKLGSDTLQFNLAHSHELAIYAFTRNRNVGIDIEQLRVMPDAEQIAARYFSVREYAAFQALSASRKQTAFFNCWTCKEAYIKAIGKGFAQPLDQFDVSLAPGESASQLNVEDAPEEAARWSLKALTPAPGYVAALAVEGNDWHLACWRFAESTSEFS